MLNHSNLYIWAINSLAEMKTVLGIHSSDQELYFKILTQDST